MNLTGSVASVKGDALEHRPVVDATQSLQGLVPGLSVSNGGSGRPRATGSLSLRSRQLVWKFCSLCIGRWCGNVSFRCKPE